MLKQKEEERRRFEWWALNRSGSVSKEGWREEDPYGGRERAFGSGWVEGRGG